MERRRTARSRSREATLDRATRFLDRSSSTRSVPHRAHLARSRRLRDRGRDIAALPGIGSKTRTTRRSGSSSGPSLIGPAALGFAHYHSLAQARRRRASSQISSRRRDTLKPEDRRAPRRDPRRDRRERRRVAHPATRRAVRAISLNSRVARIASAARRTARTSPCSTARGSLSRTASAAADNGAKLRRNSRRHVLALARARSGSAGSSGSSTRMSPWRSS